MAQDTARAVRPELRDLVREASRALSLLDADGLETLAMSCRALNRTREEAEAAKSVVGVREARAATVEMAQFGRVLEATRANLRVMRRLREVRLGSLEYAPQPVEKEI